jgi:hypothetical protein
MIVARKLAVPPRQTVVMAVRQNNTTTSRLQLQHCPVIAPPQRMTRVFNATPMYASKETPRVIVVILALPLQQTFTAVRQNNTPTSKLPVIAPPQ